MADSFIAYRRVSTKRQTIGLEIQRAGVEDYIQNGGELIAWYEDVGAAAKSAGDFSKAQPNLVRALAHSLNAQATLIVARLDRLTRSTAVLALTLEDGPPLLVVETPDASPFILQIYAAVAEEYRRQVSRRVKAGFAAAIAKGETRGTMHIDLVSATAEHANAMPNRCVRSSRTYGDGGRCPLTMLQTN